MNMFDHDPAMPESTAGGGADPPSPRSGARGTALLPPPEEMAPPRDPERRAFLHGAVIGLGAVIGAALALPLAGMLVTPLLRRPRPAPVAVGSLEKFRGEEPIAATVRFSQRQAWRRQEATRNLFVLPDADGRPVVLSARCTHLGCQVRWDAGSGAFLCPCHGGRFDREGRCLGGPPPRPLARLESRVEGGILYVALPAEA
jgi:menaquinol-cytochrome c reductase iron-sulfur subunit